ncbi:uncharacterized protein LOC131285146 [Anopheles ziemanni]|uniref:uncharacterized protein LOC131264128 n=1 Tax=Anopheles coustani TaxID=139045 RepID=UPI00265B4437|nr:uncharacterized protein LOC131264128 [Anopheles coustani]XP_058169990.1 uncharacterized protein LOC131285146 [Anopheles ziemanni]
MSPTQRARELKRQNALDYIERTRAFVTNYNEEQQHLVEPRLDRLEKTWLVFETAQDALEELSETPEQDAENRKLRGSAEELYLQLIAELQLLLPIAPKKEVKDETSNPRIKLPTISLPEFTGNYSDWITYHDTFLSMIHQSADISEVQKFHYLRASLKGEPASLIQPIALTAANYKVAWNTLLGRYSNKPLLKKKHVRELLTFPKMPNSSVEAIQTTVDAFQRHTQLLEQLGENVQQNCSMFLVELLGSKLDEASLAAWEEAQGDREPTFAGMLVFLQRRARVLETIAMSKGSDPKTSKKPILPKMSAHPAVSATKEPPKCPVCTNQHHQLIRCPRFANLNSIARNEVIKENKLCFNCFGAAHYTRDCTSKYSCRQCGKRHHSMLHPDSEANPSSESVSTTMMATAAQGSITKNILLSTVVIQIRDAYGQPHMARALLDNGSQPNAISERLCQLLRLPRQKTNIAITGIDKTTTTAKHLVTAEIQSRTTNYKRSITFLVLRKVASETPTTTIPIHHWHIPPGYPLADPEFSKSGQIDIIIGAEHFYSLLMEGRHPLPEVGNVLVESVFGWIVAGSMPNINPPVTVRCHTAAIAPTVDELLQRFWDIEELQDNALTNEENECEKYYQQTVSRDPSGRYIVRMPKHPEHEQLLGESKPAAIRRFHLLEKRLTKDPELKEQYHNFMSEYLQLGHMTAIENNSSEHGAYYLPHHPVVKSSSTTTKNAPHLRPDTIKLSYIVLQTHQNQRLVHASISAQLTPTASPK